jgi:hypothetical protein
MAKPRPQLEAVLQRLVVVIVVVVGGVLHDDGVIAFADFSPPLGFGYPFARNLDPVRGRLRLGDELFQVILQRHETSARLLQARTTRLGEHDYSPPSAGVRWSTPGQGTPCTAAYP